MRCCASQVGIASAVSISGNQAENINKYICPINLSATTGPILFKFGTDVPQEGLLCAPLNFSITSGWILFTFGTYVPKVG